MGCQESKILPIISKSIRVIEKDKSISKTRYSYQMDISSQGIKFSYLDYFIDEIGKENLVGLSTVEINKKFVKSKYPSSQNPLVQHINITDPSFVGEATWFVSYSWSDQFLLVVDSIRNFLQQEYSEQDIGEIVIWMDLFCIPQNISYDYSSPWLIDTFRKLVAHINRLLLVFLPCDSGNPLSLPPPSSQSSPPSSSSETTSDLPSNFRPRCLTRCWCLWEVYVAHLGGCRFEVALPPSQPTQSSLFLPSAHDSPSSSSSSSNSLHSPDLLHDPHLARHFYSMLYRIDSHRARASSSHDQTRLRQAMEAVPGKFATLDRTLFSLLECWMLTRLRSLIQQQESDSDLRARWLTTLASFFQHEGKLQKAQFLIEEALYSRRKILGSLHPTTLVSINLLAELCGELGKDSRAEPLFEEALQGSRIALGPAHPITLSILNKAGRFYDTHGKPVQAEPLYREVLQSQREAMGNRHPEVLASIERLALFLQAQQRYLEAEPLLLEALNLSQTLSGPDSPQTISTRQNLANVYEELGNFTKAEPLFLQSLESSRKTFGPDHPDTLFLLSTLAHLSLVHGKHLSAEILLNEHLTRCRAHWGDDHPNTLSSMFHLAEYYEQRGRLSEAEGLVKQCAETSSRVLGADHADTLDYQEKWEEIAERNNSSFFRLFRKKPASPSS